MPKIPRTISQLVENQLPAFIRESDPNFIAFLKAYYEWFENNGAEIFACKIVSCTSSSMVLSSAASGQINAYQGKSLVVLNGPSKGYTRKITSYDPAIFTAYFACVWPSDNIPLPNTSISIRDTVYPDKLFEYKDIDTTLDSFIAYFQDEFMYQIPGNILADKRNMLKHIKQFYRARGTEDSFRFLFRILFDEEIEFYYPKVDLFRASDAVWVVNNVMRITTTGNTFNFADRTIIGVASGATANVESVTQSLVAGNTVSELILSNITGTFGIDPSTEAPEQVKIVYPFIPPPQSDLGSTQDLLEPVQITESEQAYLLLQSLSIINSGDNYAVNEIINITGGGSSSPAQAIISAVVQTYYTGNAQAPPTTYYLEPYFGPAVTVNTNPDPQTDGVCIPGLYYFDDVHSEYSDSDLLSQSEIMLAANETTVDNFFDGCEIAITGGTSLGDRRNIVSYNGTTKIAAVSTPFTDSPDGTTQYSILYNKGSITAINILNFGLGFESDPVITILTADGTGAVLTPVMGLVGQTAGQWTVGRDGGIGGFPTSPDSFLDSNKVIQDSYYWQDFSYDLQFGQTIDSYRDIVQTLLHPAGLLMFGTVNITTTLTPNFLETLQQVILSYDPQVFDQPIKAYPTTVLELNGNPLPLGTRNKDLDWMKYFAFPPNTTFNLVYPYPNQDYTVYGNTQLGNLANLVIGDFVNFPCRRTKINPDAYMQVTNDLDLARVQLKPHSNFAVDSDIVVSSLSGIPSLGKLNEYVFLQGNDLHLVSNKDNDPAWTPQGLTFTRSITGKRETQIQSGLTQGTVIVVCAANDDTTDESIINNISSPSSNGFSIEARQNGGVSFRAQYGGVSKVIQYPDATITAGKYFMAALRFDQGVVSGRVNRKASKSVRFSSYPKNPKVNSSGWHFGQSASSYIVPNQKVSVFGSLVFGKEQFEQSLKTSSLVPLVAFDGVIAYALFYDRAVLDYELDFIYSELTNRLSSRGICLP